MTRIQGLAGARDAPVVSAFDPSLRGTPEHTWQSALAAVPYWAPSAGPIVIVAPHPDDESLGAGGLMHSCAALGHVVSVISVTDGEAAPHDGIDLAAIRRRELAAALAHLSSTPVPCHRLRIADGQVAANESYVQRAIEARLPPGTTLVAPFECDGHPDHDAIGRVCLQIARARQLTLARYPIWAWHHCLPHVFSGSRVVRFALSAQAQRAKARAISCFASQLEGTKSEAVVPAHVLMYFARPYETFLL
jgi:LmbE family N-acetylglucosaminyl deacetylase